MAENRTTVMILGAGVMQLPALRIARKKGWRVIAADGNPAAPGASLADVFEAVDLKDREKLLERASLHKDDSGLDGVFTAGTDFSASVAYIAEKLGLPGIPYETALDATDKSRMRRIFLRKGVPSPGYRAFSASDIDRAADSGWSYPVVVKPVDNMGARGVERVERREDLREKAEKALLFSRSGRVIVEEFIEGAEYSVDALVYRGRIHICGIADRHIFFPPFFVELGHTMPSRADEAALAEIVRVFSLAVTALGIDNGAAKGDVFLTPKGAVIGEIAARLSGGYMSGWTFPYSCGVEVTEGALNIAVGRPPGDLTPKRSWTSAERAFISIPGRVSDLLGLDAAEKIEGVRDIFTRAAEGAAVKFPENNVEKCGNIISVLPDADAAVEAAEKAAARIFIRLEPGRPETAEFLFARGARGPSAYPAALELLMREGRLAAPGEDAPALSIGSFRVAAPIRVDKEERDWNHRSIRDGLEYLSRLYGKGSSPSWVAGLVLGEVFWRAFFRGGLQGAAWLLDTLAEESSLDAAKARIGEWEN